MPVKRGIPPVSDYAHWNEEAELVWYLENKYDMEHPEVFDEDPYEDGWYIDDQEEEDEDELRRIQETEY